MMVFYVNMFDNIISGPKRTVQYKIVTKAVYDPIKVNMEKPTQQNLELYCSRLHYLDLHCAGSQGCDLLLHTVSNTRVHCGATRQDVVGIQVLSDVNIALHDAVVSGFVNAGRLHTCTSVLRRAHKRLED